MVEMGRWGGGRAAGKKNKECSGKAEEGKPWSKGWRDGEPMLAPEVCFCCCWKRGEVAGWRAGDAFVFQIEESTKNSLKVLAN